MQPHHKKLDIDERGKAKTRSTEYTEITKAEAGIVQGDIVKSLPRH